VEALLDLFEDNTDVTIPPDVDDAYELTQYATQTRYPGDWEPITEEEAEDAIAMAERILRWVQHQL